MEPSDQELPPRHRSHGCLWGCFWVVLLLVLAVGGTIGFTAWNLYQGFRNDPQLQVILDIAQKDDRVHAEFGGKVYVMEVERKSFPLPKHEGRATTYRLVLIGRSGKGELNVRLETRSGRTKTVMMILTAPDGRTRALLGKVPEQPLPSI